MAASTTLTSSQLLAATTELLRSGGYRTVELTENWPETSRVFEDPYGIVAIHIFDTWRQLADQWHIAQGLLVDLISAHLTRPEPKAWEGYLVLITPSPVVTSELARVADLRYDTNRVRKLVATGDDLHTLEDVRESLLPLLPLEIEPPIAARAGLLDRLPELLSGEGIPNEVTRTVVDAFIDNESMLERLHVLRGNT